MKDRSILLSLVIFFVVIACFWFGLNNVDQNQDKEDLQRVQKSIKAGILECYSVEGKYPESLTYLQKHYGVYINQKQYLVHYTYQGANLYPEISAYRKGEQS